LEILFYGRAQKAAELLIPEGVWETIGKAIEGFLVGMSSAAELVVNRDEIKERVKDFFDKDGNELKSADEAARHYWNWHIAYAAAEGGTTGIPGLPGLIADVPLLCGICLRLIKIIGSCYCYDTTRPEEQEYVMHILRTGMAGDIKAKMEFQVTLKQIEQILLKVTWEKMHEAYARKEISRLSLLAAIKQFSKSLGIQLTKRKALQMVPVIGALVGASFNAALVNDVAWAAYMSYRRRWIKEREEGENGPVISVK